MADVRRSDDTVAKDYHRMLDGFSTARPSNKPSYGSLPILLAPQQSS